MTHHTEAEHAEFEQLVRNKWPLANITRSEEWGYLDDDVDSKFFIYKAARRAPAVPETIEQRAKKLKGLQVLIGATAGVPEAIELARSRFTEAYGRSPLHDDLAYACLLIDAYGGAPAAPVPQGWKPVPMEPTLEMRRAFDSAFTEYLAEDDDEKNDIWLIKKIIEAAPQPPEKDNA